MRRSLLFLNVGEIGGALGVSGVSIGLSAAATTAPGG